MATGEHSGYAYAGLLAPWALDDRWTAGLSLAAGAYRRGDGKDLGSGLEFRSQAEVSYRLDNGHRLGVSAAHLSNAGVGHRNPGTNILMLATYAVPLD
ncbi:MAG: acyloxyacyl hydrolase [Alphaproteobacteria bacterium]|nr:acyloxyacyl hydrolase [Alphaproteobacteria bacterium]